MLRGYLGLNRNILAGFAASITASAAVAQLLAGEEDHLNTTYTTLADYAVYFAVFGGLFYADNRARYRLPGGGTDRARLRADLRKLVASLGAGELVYTAARWALQYHLLTAGYDPYLASAASQGISTVIYMGVVNLGVRVAGLHGR